MAPVTSTEKEHEALAERVAPVMLIVVSPAVAVMVWSEIVPSVHEGPENPFGVATTSPVGRLSEKLTPVNEVLLGLVNVNVSVLLVPCPMVVGEKALERVGLVGRGHPVIVISSSKTEDVLLWLPLVCAVMRNHVLFRPVVSAVPEASCQEAFLRILVEETSVKLVPSVLE